MYYHIFRGKVRGCAYMHVHTFSKNVWAHASVHAVFSVEAPLLSVEVSMHVPTQAYVHALPRLSLIVIPCFCLSVHVPQLESVLMMDVLRVCLLLCPTDSPSSSVMRVTALGVGKVSGYILGGGSLVIVGVGGDGAAGVAVTRLVVV